MQMACLDAPHDLAKEKLALSADHYSRQSRPIMRELDALLLRSLTNDTLMDMWGCQRKMLPYFGEWTPLRILC